jgi:hypothetical protein
MADNKPIKKFRAGKFDAAIWSQPSKQGEGELFSITFRKSWTKDGKTWDEAKMSIFSREIPDAIALLQTVHSDLRVSEQTK